MAIEERSEVERNVKRREGVREGGKRKSRIDGEEEKKLEGTNRQGRDGEEQREGAIERKRGQAGKIDSRSDKGRKFYGT